MSYIQIEENGDEISLCNKTQQLTYYSLGKKHRTYPYVTPYAKIKFKRGR